MDLPVNHQLQFFSYVWACFIPGIRLLSFNLYKKRLRLWGIIALVSGILAPVLLPYIPNRLSLWLLGPLLSIGLMELSDHLYTKYTGQALFEADEYSSDPERNPFGMALYETIILTVLFTVPGLIWSFIY